MRRSPASAPESSPAPALAPTPPLPTKPRSPPRPPLPSASMFLRWPAAASSRTPRGPSLRSGATYLASRRGLHPALTLSGRSILPFDGSGEDVTCRANALAMRALGSLEFVHTSWIALLAGGGGGADVLWAAPKSALELGPQLASPTTRADPIVSAFVATHIKLAPGFALTVMALGDLDLAPSRYVVVEGTAAEPVLAPWRVRPTLLGGFTFTAIGHPAFAAGEAHDPRGRVPVRRRGGARLRGALVRPDRRDARLAARGGRRRRAETGCSSDSPCASGLYCSMPTCNSASGTCAAPPNCAYDGEDPHCGCDGITYFNDCLRQANGISASSPGPFGGGCDTNAGIPQTVCARRATGAFKSGENYPVNARPRPRGAAGSSPRHARRPRREVPSGTPVSPSSTALTRAGPSATRSRSNPLRCAIKTR